jgi:hypothetical protein
MPDEQEVEVEICCDVLLDAIQSGGIQVVEVAPGVYREVVPDQDGASGIAVNFCPFCGQERHPQSEGIVSPNSQ